MTGDIHIMIAPPEVVAQLLVAAIALLAIIIGLLQFYPRIVVAWKPKSAEIPISQLVQYAGIRRMLNAMKWSIGALSLSVFFGLGYLLLEAIHITLASVPLWLDLLIIFIGIILFGLAIGIITVGAIKLNIEEFSERLEEKIFPG